MHWHLSLQFIWSFLCRKVGVRDRLWEVNQRCFCLFWVLFSSYPLRIVLNETYIICSFYIRLCSISNYLYLSFFYYCPTSHHSSTGELGVGRWIPFSRMVLLQVFVWRRNLVTTRGNTFSNLLYGDAHNDFYDF